MMVNFEKFKTWLGAQGAEVLLSTNMYEVVRFKTSNGVSVIYYGKKGYTFTGESETAYEMFKEHKRWKVVNRKRQQLHGMKARLASRDGRGCFFCKSYESMSGGLMLLTVEHILSVMHGGTDNPNNLALACDDCQKILGVKSVTQKIMYRDKVLNLRSERIEVKIK